MLQNKIKIKTFATHLAVCFVFLVSPALYADFPNELPNEKTILDQLMRSSRLEVQSLFEAFPLDSSDMFQNHIRIIAPKDLPCQYLTDLVLNRTISPGTINEHITLTKCNQKIDHVVLKRSGSKLENLDISAILKGEFGDLSKLDAFELSISFSDLEVSLRRKNKDLSMLVRIAKPQNTMLFQYTVEFQTKIEKRSYKLEILSVYQKDNIPTLVASSQEVGPGAHDIHYTIEGENLSFIKFMETLNMFLAILSESNESTS